MSLRTRLALGSAAAMVAVVVVVAGLVYVTVRDQMRSQIDGQLRDRAAVIAPFVPAVLANPEIVGRVRIPTPPAGRAEGVIQIVGRDGSTRTPEGTAAVIPVDPAARRIAAGSGDAVLRDARVGDDHLRVLTAPVPGVGALQVALSLEDVDTVLARLRWAMLLIGLAGVALAGVLAALVARAGLAPVRRLDRTAGEVAHTGDLTRRIAVEGDDEVGRLAGTFNEMLAALQRSQEAQRQLVVDASHELRTPLTALRTNIEVLAADEGADPPARERLVADITGQLGDLGSLVADVVSLARGTEPEEDLEQLRLDALVRAAVERAARDAPGLRFLLDAEPSMVLGAPAQLSRAVGNLLGNAAKWSPPGGEVAVRVADGEVVVRDHGPGIPPEDLPHVFDRFYRSASARRLPGSGLGLAIVRQAAEAHGGTATAEHAPGGGALMRLRLPRIESSPAP